MKKLYKKGKVHPSPPLISDHLAFLPAAILTLAAGLSPQDREVLAYLISCSSSPPNTGNNKKTFNGGTSAEHPPMFYCNCFRCYTSYWVRWDASPNHQLIHDIIEAFEGELTRKMNMKSHKKDRKNKRGHGHGQNYLNGSNDDDEPIGVDSTASDLVSVSPASGDDGEDVEEEFEKGAVRKLVSFIGDTIWGVWN